METLLKLEELQKSIQFAESTNGDRDTDRFLASFLVFLTQPCGELDFENKCTLVSDYIPKISASLCSIRQELRQEQHGFEKDLQYNYDGSSNFDVALTDFEDTAMVSLDAMQRANSTLEDFCRSYFMFHGMDVNNPHAIFKYFPMLSFTESYIYQLDSLNEMAINVQTNGVQCSNDGYEEVNLKSVARFTKAFKNGPFRPLADLLDRHGLLTEKMKEEFLLGEEYWNLERKLCCALTNGKEIHVEDVMRAINLKSFDYRVLNLLLYQLRGEKVDELHMEFLSVSELLVEIADDLFDYEDDVEENSFNVLRMFVKIYGTSAPTMLAKVITEAEEKYDVLLNGLDSQMSFGYQRRCAEATIEGGNTSKHPLGTWNIPPLILDEELYRSRMRNPS